MAFFQPPAPPEGYEYVVRDQNYVLVPKSELTEDICAATGRTWAEEARLYNIRNAPDSKTIAEPGDPFYQTAESMKNRGKEIKGISAGSLKFINQLSGTSDAKGPSLNDTLAKIKDGSVNADIGAALDEVSGISDSLPDNLKSELAAARADIAEKIQKAQKDLPKLAALAQANQELVTKKAAAEGRAPTQAELKAAAGALSIFEDGPALLEKQAKAISGSLIEEAGAFEVELPNDIIETPGLIPPALGKLAGAAKQVGAAIADKLGIVPNPTIPNPDFDPENPGTVLPSLPNPDFEAFSADPANAETVATFQNVLGKVQGIAGELSAKFGEVESKQEAAVAGGIEELKAFAFAAQLAQPATGLLGAARSLSVDPSAFDAGEITKAISKASSLGPSIDTSLLKGTKDEDLTYTGDDGIVWDRTNTERERRGLPGLASLGFPRPEDPPLVPAGATPPKPPDTVFPKPKALGLDEAGPAPVPKVEKAVFNKSPDEKVSKDFAAQYYKIYAIWEEEEKTLNARLQKDADAYYPGWSDIRPQSKAIETNKPDVSERTTREVLIVEEVNKLRPLIQDNAEFYQRYKWVNDRRREIQQYYTSIRELWLNDGTYAQIPPGAESVLAKDGGPSEYKKFIGKTYKTFEAWRKDNADVDLSFIGKYKNFR
jgi:hypothetical protein